jgi:murein DD-endopeptidase MepM/ murein hydrolase activator NlpD
MRRPRLVLAVAIALAAALLGSSAPAPASASCCSSGLLPSPLPVPLPPLPTLPPLPVPLPTPVTGIVNRVLNPTPAPAPAPPSRNASGTGEPAPPASGGAGGQPAAAAPTPTPVPERAVLPAEPQRIVLEQQQASLADAAPSVDQRDAARALALGAGDGTFIWPVVFEGRPPITQPFGCTDLAGEPYSPDCATHRFHTGIDLGVPTGTPVYAAAPGVAHPLPSDGGYGNLVLVAHGNGWFTLYAHLSRFAVHDGDVVRRGALVGRSGSTGFSTGPHLHFEIRSGQRPVDPCVHLDC